MDSNGNEIEAFCRALKAFCVAKGFEIAGTCHDEGIYGEITVHKIGEPIGTAELTTYWEKNKFNFCYPDGEMVEPHKD